MEEIWRDIKGYEGKYQVSNFGRIRSFIDCKGKQYVTPIIKSNRVKSGSQYLIVTLWKNGKGQTFKVHRLVAQAFIPNPNNLQQVNHKDENPHNNNMENLEWCDSKYNCNYGTRNKRISKTREKNKTCCKRVLCVETGIVYESINEASRQVGVSVSNIGHCCNHTYRHKTCGGYHWEFL